MAQLINLYSGGAVVGAWEVDQLPESLIETYIALATRLHKMKSGINENEQIMAKHRARHAREHGVRYSK